MAGAGLTGTATGEEESFLVGRTSSMLNETPTMRAGNDAAHRARHEYLQIESAILATPELKDQLLTWLQQHRQVDYIIDYIHREYGITLTPTQLSAFSVRQGIDRRDSLRDLLPWKILRHSHRRMYSYLMLNAEAKLRAGVNQPAEILNRLILWKRRLHRDGLVIDYQPHTRDVWHEVPARPGIDVDLVRVP